MYGEFGNRHGGCDCIIFPRRMYASFAKNNACIGRSYVMRALVFNCIHHAKRFLVLTTAHLTFHLGNDREWADDRYSDYSAFNFSEGKNVLRAIATNKDATRKLLSSIGGVRLNKEFARAIYLASGLKPEKVTFGQVMSRKLKGLRRRIARRIISGLKSWAA
jgi:hypothetical protein